MSRRRKCKKKRYQPSFHGANDDNNDDNIAVMYARKGIRAFAPEHSQPLYDHLPVIHVQLCMIAVINSISI